MPEIRITTETIEISDSAASLRELAEITLALAMALWPSLQESPPATVHSLNTWSIRARDLGTFSPEDAS